MTHVMLIWTVLVAGSKDFVLPDNKHALVEHVLNA